MAVNDYISELKDRIATAERSRKEWERAACSHKDRADALRAQIADQARRLSEAEKRGDRLFMQFKAESDLYSSDLANMKEADARADEAERRLSEAVALLREVDDFVDFWGNPDLGERVAAVVSAEGEDR